VTVKALSVVDKPHTEKYMQSSAVNFLYVRLKLKIAGLYVTNAIC